MGNLFKGRQQVPYSYSCFGYTRGNGKTWHGGLDVVGLDSTTILMPDYDGKIITGTVVQARKVPEGSSDKTWEWGWYVCVQLDANQTPDTINYLYFCHNEKNLVSVGQKVKSGDSIAIMGNTGNAKYANPPIKHVHFECRASRSGSGLDPTHYAGCSNKVGIYQSSDNNTNKTFNGVDVSKYQGNIDWTQVKNAGYSFAFVRVGYCDYQGPIAEGKDPYFEQNMQNAIAAGLNVGIYVYSYATTTSAAEVCAEQVINYAKNYKITMPIAFDFEDSKTYASKGKATNTAICKAFLNKIQNAGYYAMLYTYTSFANSYLNMSDLSAFDLWIADYRGYVGYQGAYGIWQHSSTTKVPGISGNCDVNIAYKDYPLIISGISGGGDMSNVSISDLRYKVLIPNKAQGFNSKNVNDVRQIDGSDYLPVGTYKLIQKEDAVGEQGFYWCEIRLPDGSSCYANYNLPDGRCEIVVKEIDTPVSGKSIKIITANKCQAFGSRDVNDVVKFGDSSYIPVGIYKLITMDDSP